VSPRLISRKRSRLGGVTVQTPDEVTVGGVKVETEDGRIIRLNSSQQATSSEALPEPAGSASERRTPCRSK
jgi:hypothetical protein